jgi:hypothetical protein
VPIQRNLNTKGKNKTVYAFKEAKTSGFKGLEFS